MIVALGGRENGQEVLEAEWIDPENPDLGWKLLAAMTYGRSHHMTALLLLDGTVLVAGKTSTGSHQAEIFQPPYLFTENPRPEINSAPTSIRSEQTFTVRLGAAVPAQHIGQVNLLRLGAVTHSFDQNQRLVPLTFDVVNASTLSVDPVGNANRAPPGSYMLFVVSDALPLHVPSEGRYVDVAAVAVVAP
jgi:hypothetical protein